jgi:uncharacterized protein (DUF1800 family)
MPQLLEGKAAVGHLLRRAGFGPDLATWSTWSALSYEDAVDRVLAECAAPPPTTPAGFDPYELGAIQNEWLRRMRGSAGGLPEKLTLFWHGHFATSDDKIKDPLLMWTQYEMLRRSCGGSFRDLVLGISRDVAMIRWLDGNANRIGHPNENYGRELQELFTLGVGNYSETDIREVSRAFSGWGSRHHSFRFQEEFHDKGTKTIHGQTGAFGGEEVIDILLAQPACARFLAGKLLRFFSHPDPSTEEVETFAGVLRDNDYRIEPSLAALFRAPAFRDPARYRSLVRSPVEFVIGALRAIGGTEVAPWMHGALDRMGQILFRPPSVKGWTRGSGWMSSGAVVERLRAAQKMALEAAQAGAAETILEVALQEVVAGQGGVERIATVLGGPEFQLC